MSDYYGSSSKASNEVKQLVLNEKRSRKSQKRKAEINEERRQRHREQRDQERQEEESNRPAYRDRAKELKELGYDKDYEGLRPEDFANYTEEDLQLLGGDERYCHLIKGLGVMLLDKKRKEIEQENELKRKEEETLSMKHFNTPMASNIYNHLFESHQQLDDINTITSKREYFTKGRSTYPLRTEGDIDDIMYVAPATSVHSKQESTPFDSLMMDSLASPVYDLITKSLANIGASKIKRRRRKERKTIKAVDEDVDMFSD